MKTVVFSIIAVLCVGHAAWADETSEAEKRYLEGQAAYDRGDYSSAVIAWRESYRLSGEAELLYDLAQALRLAGQTCDAFTTYQKFLAVGDSDKVPMAQGFAKELTPKCAPEAQVTPPPPNIVFAPPVFASPSFATPRRTSRSNKLIGLAVVGGGLALVVTSTYFGHEASLLGNQVTTACRVSCSWTTEKSVEARGQRDETFEWVTLGTGAIALGIGTWLTYEGVMQDQRLSIAATPVRGGAAVTWSRPW